MKRSAFTLIELLVVIAIIAILAAIAFPVIARAKDSAFRNSDISSMNTLRAALQLYRVDQGANPPALLGYVTLYTTGPNIGQVIPADQIRSFLYPKRVDNVNTFKPSYLKVGLTATTTAVWPEQDPRAVGSAPIMDNNGDGAITALDDDACARQAYGPLDGNVQRRLPDGTYVDAEFYSVSGYDVAEVKTPSGTRHEIHYALFWTKWGLNSDPGGCGGPGSSLDDPRQLGYSDPPEDTLVTWNTYFRDYTAGGIAVRDKRDIVLFLGGSSKVYDSLDVAERSWRVLP